MAGIFAILYSLLWSVVRTWFGVEGYFFMPTGLLLLALGVIYAVVGAGIISDNRLVVLTRRELTAFFCSPIAYVVLVGMALMGWFNFLFFVKQIVREPALEPILSGYFFNFIFVFSF